MLGENAMRQELLLLIIIEVIEHKKKTTATELPCRLNASSDFKRCGLKI